MTARAVSVAHCAVRNSSKFPPETRTRLAGPACISAGYIGLSLSYRHQVRDLLPQVDTV